MTKLESLAGKSFNEGIKILEVRGTEFNFVREREGEEERLEVSIEYIEEDDFGDITYLVTYTLTDDMSEKGCEDEEWYPDYDNFTHDGY